MADQHNFRYFDALDYTVFGLMLALSALIGVYYAFFAKQKQNTRKEYLLGGKTMGIFPISMSLVASYISGIAMIGFPSEIYVFGTQFWFLVVPELFVAYFMSKAIIPVFFKLQITSTYEYLNRRFSPHVRTLGSCLFMCKMLLYIPIVIYVPALAFAQVSGFSLNVMIPMVCVVCIFYTTLGGMKAVVWTDTVQTMLMILGSLTVVIMGTYDVGGPARIWKISQEGGRIDFFNMSWDPRIRHTFWNILIGKFFQHLASCTINQAMVQRCLAMPTLRKAKITIGIFAVGISFFVSMSCFSGLIIYTAFHDCDPQLSGEINKADQLLPYFVMKITSHVPALPGVFVAGIFSAALSTMSTGLNSMCGIILEDFIRPLCKKPLSEGKASFIMKVVTVILGAICVLLAFIVDKLGGLIQTSGSLGGITGGTLLGMFILGMFFPWANTTGVLSGGIAAASLVTWMSIGSQLAIYRKQLVFPLKPVTSDGCGNSTLGVLSTVIPLTDEGSNNDLFILYNISYVYYTVIGVVTVITVGMIVSWMTGFNDPLEVDPDLLSPLVKNFFQPKNRAKLERHKEEGVIASVTNSQLQPFIEDQTNEKCKSGQTWNSWD